MLDLLQKEKSPLVRDLEKLLGKQNVLSSKEERYCYAFDTAKFDELYLPDVVVLPENKEDVVEIVKLANKYQTPIIPRGAGTNHNGSTVAKKGGIILHFGKMDKIIEIDKNNLTCKVQPGVVVGTLQEEVKKQGLFYPPDPSNLKVSTIGGSIALSSSGPRNFKYGSTKDYILNLEVILADGSVINTGFDTAKNATGYNLTQLMIGSEGTLGIVTQATIKLIPHPQEQQVMLVFFDNLDDSANTVTQIISEKLTPSTIDLIDKATIQTIERFYPTGLLIDKEAALIIEVDGDKSSVENQIERITEICNKNNSCEIRVSTNEKEAQKIWFARRSAFGAVAKLAPNVITEDAVVPRDKIPHIVREIQRICKKYNVKACIMGHAGDGNIHPNFSLDLRNEDEKIRFQKACDEFFEVALSMGGSLSGEHGIGMTKSKYMQKATSYKNIALMKSIKQTFDPNNILNPGKIV